MANGVQARLEHLATVQDPQELVSAIEAVAHDLESVDELLERLEGFFHGMLTRNEVNRPEAEDLQQQVLELRHGQ